ncbi:tellurite resistance protein TehB [Salmonella enterica subsp. enterica serovar Agona str. 241981]|nr:tellurite resistance protein TehB [Salmonella enterica subsp. enterica serovar Agona str. 241981]
MSHLRIPANWKVKRSTPFFTKENVPAALLSHHNTAAGVFGQLCVMEGTVTYYGFANETATEPEVKVVINAGQFATSPPQYWHRVELSDDARFNIHFLGRGRPSGRGNVSTEKSLTSVNQSPLGGSRPVAR